MINKMKVTTPGTSVGMITDPFSHADNTYTSCLVSLAAVEPTQKKLHGNTTSD